MLTPTIITNRIWSIERVRRACINNDLYTRGDNEDYDHMLQWVRRLYPNTENMYFIAQDICEHSEDQTIANVMFILENEAILTAFEIDDTDSI